MSVTLGLSYLFAVCLLIAGFATPADLGRDIIVVAGNFSIDGKALNIAQYDISTGK